MIPNANESVTMVRTTCCETFRSTGTRCPNCPCLRENRAAAQMWRELSGSTHLGQRLGVPTQSWGELQVEPQPFSRIIAGESA
ncbi:MAG: hypothetical protein MUC42_16915 [Bryobacter sp.]|nr:hypothetical protein [Bryobacter sp.]